MYLKTSALVATLIVSMGAAAGLSAAERRPGVLATVNGTDIAVEDFHRELARVEHMILDTGRPLTCPQITRLRTEVAEGLVRRELLYQESRKVIKVADADIDAEVKKLKDRYAGEAEFNAALTSMRITPSSFRGQVERALTIAKAIETQYAPRAVVTDKEVRAAYDQNRDTLRQPEQVRASHILIKAGPQDQGKKAAARRKAEEVLEKIRKGQDFASLARTYSEDPTGAKGGDLGYIRQGQVLKPFEEALFVLKTGETSGVVETALGYHIIRATDRKPETTIPFETVRDQLRTLLKQKKGEQEANAHIGKVREKTKVDIFLPAEEQ
jgi:peptidyl-prolyl cis-trans isomerase C